MKTRRRLLSMGVAVGAVVLAGCGGTAGPKPTPTPIPLGPMPQSIALPQGSAAPFAIEGSVLAWSGIPRPRGACPQNDVYLANARAYRPRVIWKGAPCAVVSDVRISAAWVVWEAGASPGGSIWAYRRATGRVYRVAGQPRPPALGDPCDTPGCLPNFSFGLWGDVAVWSAVQFQAQGTMLTSSISGKVLPSGPTRTLFTTTAACTLQTSPSLAAGRVVWLQETWPSQGVVAGDRRCQGLPRLNVVTELVGSTFRKGRRAGLPFALQQITSSGLTSDPQTNGRFVAWQDRLGVATDCACSDLDVYDTRTNSVVTAARMVPLAHPGYALSGRFLAWIAAGTGSERVLVARLGPRHLRLTGIRVLARSGTPAAGRFVRTFGWPSTHRVVWEFDRVIGLRDNVRVVIRQVA